MTEANQGPRIAVLGAGAVGCYFGGMLARAGTTVTLIGRPQHVEAINRAGLLFDSQSFRGPIPLAASTEVSAVRDAQVVLFCVKTPDTEDAARSLAPHLADGGILVSLQNGVDNVERIQAATGIEAIAAVVYVAAEMVAPGSLKHNGRGDLIVGDFWKRPGQEAKRRQDLDLFAALFTRAGVPCRISDNIHADLWTKMIMNCACNAISALSRARYGRIVGHEGTHEVMKLVVEEAVAVAQATGVRFPNLDHVQAAWTLAETMFNATSSTAQDIARGKRTEIDALNGHVLRRGRELGIATPVNQTLHALVKLLEEAK